LVKELIHKFKYEKRMSVRHGLVELLYCFFNSNIASEHIDIITYVPMHPVDMRKRGFNQSMLLAEGLAKKTGIILAKDAIIKHGKTRQQVSLTREQRLDNVKQAFTFKKDAALSRKRILIIDDVFTTGATINECAKILKQNNAGAVFALTLAKGV
jgi:ComF family protein